MENEKLILEMLAEMNKTMLEMKQEQIEMRVEMREGFESVIKRIDTVENRLEKIHNTLLIMNMPTYEPTEEELEAIRIGKEQFANGEYTSYNSIEEMKKDIMNDD